MSWRISRKIFDRNSSKSLLISSIKEMLRVSSWQRILIMLRTSHGNTTCVSLGLSKKPIHWKSFLSIWQMLHSTTASNILVSERNSFKLLSLINAIWLWLKHFTCVWVALLSGLQAQVKLNPSKHWEVNSVDSCWSSTVMRHSISMQWVVFSLVFVKSVHGVASMSSIDWKRECFQHAHNRFYWFRVVSEKEQVKSNWWTEKSNWMLKWVFSSRWILDTLVVRIYLKTSSNSSDKWQWSSQTEIWLRRSCCTRKVSRLQKSSQERLFHFSSCAMINFHRSHIMTSVCVHWNPC